MPALGGLIRTGVFTPVRQDEMQVDSGCEPAEYGDFLPR